MEKMDFRGMAGAVLFLVGFLLVASEPAEGYGTVAWCLVLLVSKVAGLLMCVCGWKLYRKSAMWDE